MTRLPAEAVLLILRRYANDVGMDAVSIVKHVSETGAIPLTPYEIDRFLQLMQLAGWTMMEPPNGDSYRRYHLTPDGVAQASRLASEPTEPFVELAD